ncbi:hypothetical protein [Mangrovicoccus ximenensis]|uniref:hypothetical protein n=1 Tax=Mangrovicoccus ximenensis TaxID=1911570 RepID=UPI000D36EC07|nr:hypothetical protein [Mangrovicoccus ximenensis]
MAKPRVRAATRRIADRAFAEKTPALEPLPAMSHDVLRAIGRRGGREGRVPVGGTLHSVHGTARKRMLEVQHHASALRISEA